MEMVLQEFDSTVQDSDSDAYRVFLHGRSRRPHDTWQGWLVFVRQRDGRRFETAVETTQPNRESLLFWATGLTSTYLGGALIRARGPISPAAALTPSAPVTGQDGDDSGRDDDAAPPDDAPGPH